MTGSESAVAQALVIVDVQRGWMQGPHAVVGADALGQALQDAAESARLARCPVVHLRDVGDEGSRVPVGGPGRDLVLPVQRGDLVIDKSHGDGFRGTDLDAVLRSFGVRRFAVGGLQSERCVADTARGGIDRGYDLLTSPDLHSTYDLAGTDREPALSAATVGRVALHALGPGVTVIDASDLRFAGPDG